MAKKVFRLSAEQIKKWPNVRAFAVHFFRQYAVWGVPENPNAVLLKKDGQQLGTIIYKKVNGHTLVIVEDCVNKSLTDLLPASGGPK